MIGSRTKGKHGPEDENIRHDKKEITQGWIGHRLIEYDLMDSDNQLSDQQKAQSHTQNSPTKAVSTNKIESRCYLGTEHNRKRQTDRLQQRNDDIEYAVMIPRAKSDQGCKGY